eukprot:c30078_g1_i1 orf=39-236(+)
MVIHCTVHSTSSYFGCLAAYWIYVVVLINTPNIIWAEYAFTMSMTFYVLLLTLVALFTEYAFTMC